LFFNNITISAKDDVTIASAQDSYYHFSAGKTGRGKSFLNKSESTTQVSSDLTTTNNGNIAINSGVNNTDTVGSDGAKGNLTITASNLTTRDDDGNSANNTGSGNITLAARNEVDIESALNTSYSESFSSKKGSSSFKSSKDVAIDAINVFSNISSNGNIQINSGSDTNITASNLSGTNGSILVGKYTDTNPLSATYGQQVINNDAKLTIASGQDYHYKYHEETKIKTDRAAMVVGAAAAIAVVVATGGTGAVAIASAGAGGALTGAQGKRGRTLTNETTEIVQKSSNLNFTNDLNIDAVDMNKNPF
jgi:hypothetical protein